MPKISALSTLAASSWAAGDSLVGYDVSATSAVKVLIERLLEAALLTSTGFMKLASSVLSVGPNGATNPSFQVDGSAASAVNGVLVTGAATGSAGLLSAIGSDTNVALDLAGKGSGLVRARTLVVQKNTQTAKVGTATLTIAELLTGVIDGTPVAAATYTLPTAANLVAGLANARVGDTFDFVVNNKSAGANTITIAAGSGGTADGTLTVAQDVIRLFRVIVTNVTGASEAYFVYGIGS